jgi:hypothetical protein
MTIMIHTPAPRTETIEEQAAGYHCKVLAWICVAVLVGGAVISFCS